MSERVGRGAWARRLAIAVVPNEASMTAERGRELARIGRVDELAFARGEITAAVGEARRYEVALRTRPIPPRVWTEVGEAARGRPELEEALAGRDQSIHLQHELTADWAEPLVPRTESIRATCSCSGDREPGQPCQHVAAVAYAAAEAIDADPSALLRWRGLDGAPAPHVVAPQAAVTDEDPWAAGELPPPRPKRALPAGAVLMRLGPTGVNAGGIDLAEALQRAYDAFDGRASKDS